VSSSKVLPILVVAVALFSCNRQAAAQSTFEVRVVTGNDDAEERSSNGYVVLTSTDLELSTDALSELTDTVGMRFTGVTIAQGETITNAYIQFEVDETYANAAASLTIRGQDIDDAPGFTTATNNITSRTTTTASVAWSPPVWNTVDEAGTDQRTPDMTAIIQEIVDRGGWVSGNDIVIIINGTGSRTAESYNGEAGAAALLHIEYGSGGGGASLLTWWKLDESSGTTATDSSSNNTHGALAGNPVWQSSGGHIDGALEFDGSGDQVEDADAENYLNGLTAVSVSVWVESDVTNVDRGIFTTQTPAGSDDNLAMRYDSVGSGSGGNQVIKFALETTSGNKNYESSAMVQTTAWQFLVITWDSGQSPKLYIDGTLDTLGYDGGSLGGSITLATTLLVGIGPKSGYWDGRIDDFRIYDGVLTPAEITALYSGGGGASGSHHWALNETSGTTTVDSIGSSDGTLVNFPGDNSQWSCFNGGSLLFDGVDDYVSLPTESDYDYTTAITVAAWVNVTSFNVADQAIVTKGDTAWRLERNAGTDTVKFTVDGLATNTVVQGSISINDDNWHHVAGVYDGSDLLLYVDGVLDNSVTATGTMDENNDAVYLGGNAGVAGRGFNGRIDDVYIYDTALSAASILALAQQSQLGWWKLDETSGTTANDESAYDNNGSLQNMGGTEWTAGQIDNGLDFDGSADWVNTTIASNTTTTVTMMAWFKSNDAGSIGDSYVTQRFVTQRDAAASSRFAVGINNDRVAVYWDDGASNIQEGTTVLSAGVWYHAALTNDGATIRLYVDGIEEGNWAEASLSTPSADTFEIGAGGGTRFFNGILDDVRLYDRELCAAEIVAIYQQGIVTAQSHHWALNETSGTTAADSIGSSHGTLWGFPGDDSQWTCQNGTSLTFDGVDDYVALPTETDYDFTDYVTVAAWIQVTSFNVAEQAIVTKGDTAWRLERYGSTNALQFAIDGLTTNTVVQGSVSVNDGGWHHVAGVYDGSQLLLYVNGVLDTAVTATGTMDTNNSSVYFGDNAEVAGRYFNGQMDDVYIYDTALSPATILGLAQQSQVGWWKLDESSGTTASDDSAYGNDGSLQNMDGSEWTTGKIDNGLDFDGSADWINTTIASNLSTTVTMTAWFKSDDAGTIGDNYLSQRFLTQRDAADSSRLAVGINSDRVAVYWDDGASFTQEGTTPLVADVWYHAALTYDGATIRLYVNGAEEGNWAEATMSTPTADTFEIASGGGTRLFDGVLDDVRLYTRALCATEIDAIFKQGVPGVRIVSWQEVDPFP